MSLFWAELRKVWGNRLFPLLLAVLAAANLLLLWMGTRPTAGQPSAAVYRAVGAQLDGLTMEEKGAYLHGKYTEIESLVKIGGFYRDMAYAGSSYLQAYRDENAAMFDAYEQEYKDKCFAADIHHESLVGEFLRGVNLCPPIVCLFYIVFKLLLIDIQFNFFRNKVFAFTVYGFCWIFAQNIQNFLDCHLNSSFLGTIFLIFLSKNVAILRKVFLL